MEPACVRACAFGALKVVRCPSEELPADRSLCALCEELAKIAEITEPELYFKGDII